MRFSEILTEATTNRVTVFYGGRFQPMHKGHFALYQSLTQRFGADNVFIASTFGQKQQAMHKSGDFVTDPFTFEEKASIANEMFGISTDKFVNTQPYRPEQVKVGRSDSEYALILAFSEKDAGRLKSGGVLAPLPEDTSRLQTPDEDRVYFVTMPVNEGGMSATDFRQTMASEKPEAEKKKMFTQFFGKMNDRVFKFIENRLT